MSEFAPDEYSRPILYRIRCQCGNLFYLAISPGSHALFAIAKTQDEALELLAGTREAQVLRDIEIPDFLPPEI